MFLEHTIGYLENEHESFLTVQYILFGSLAYMIVGSLLEGWLFYLYNEKFHPFKKILDPDDGIELKICQNCKVCLTILVIHHNKLKPQTLVVMNVFLCGKNGTVSKM